MAAESTETSDDSTKPTILVVEDNQVIIRSYRHIFFSMQALKPYGLMEFESAWLAMEWLAKVPDARKPVVIILDWVMEGFDGMNLLEKLKQDSRWKDIPVLMVTSNRDKASVVEACRMGVRDYLIKPLQPMILAKKIGKILANPQETAGQASPS